jgi:thiamine pyrophosphokinase
MNVFIFLSGNPSSGDFYRDHFEAFRHMHDVVVCVDGGYRLSRRSGIKPDLVIGDLDSLEDEQIEEGIEVRRYSPDKDFSDFELALRAAEEMEPGRVYVYGALGGRIDHELTNVLLLSRSKYPTVFIEENVEIYRVIEHLVLKNRKGCFCSLLPLSGPCHVEDMRGFRYILHGEMLQPSSRGLSNIITEDRATISVHSGSLIAVVSLPDTPPQY